MERYSFIGCTNCYGKKKDCKCKLPSFHRISPQRYDKLKFDIVEKSCGKEIMTSRTNRDDAIHCGEVLFSEIQLCSECSKEMEAIAT